jgi:adenine-specific DNA-methyltransferase
LRELRNRNIKFNKENRPNLYYPFYINPKEVDSNGLHTISLEPHNGWVELYPLESQGINTVWRWGKEKSLKNMNINIMAKPMRNGSYMIVEKYRESRMMARSVWWDKDTNTEKGTRSGTSERVPFLLSCNGSQLETDAPHIVTYDQLTGRAAA